MRKCMLITLILLSLHFSAISQRPAMNTEKKPTLPSGMLEKKYGSLLWEITGNGLKKPSYLFGTMHISSKLAFHLGDSFYNAIRSVDVVALETNPEDWQDNYSESIFLKNNSNYSINEMFSRSGNDKMTIASFLIDNYDEAIKAALSVEPSMVNGLLYRTYGNKMSDFEEDTYLDMYIFQTGKKLGKKIAGVENFKQSEKLVLEAYRDMLKDDKRKRKSYDMEGAYSNPKKLEEAYRKGDLDVLDSLDALEVVSDAFQEKFLYKRNEIQAKNIDSIIKRSSLFVAVGAAHLPGKRGVIEILRKMGYSLKAIKMDDRNSRQKESIDKIRFATSFITQKSEDGFYEVTIPGKKFYTFTNWSGLDTKQFADMSNGSYYLTIRVKTNGHFQGHNTETVYKKIDSLLYENIPGKILRKTPITRNGYKGWEIVNRLRRGDHQRYNIFVTPFEVVIFKMSGTAEYVTTGTEADQFFSSVKMKEYREAAWNSFQPATGGFSVQLPHIPSLLWDGNSGNHRLEYAAYDQQNSYLVMQMNMMNFTFAEEDTFELNLMDESYAFSGFIDKQISHKFFTQNSYPGLEAKYLHKDGSYSTAKFIIRGPVYYVAVTRYKAENEGSKKFIESFLLKPFIYPETKVRVDTGMHFTVQSPFFTESKEEDEQEKLMNIINMYRDSEEDDEDAEESVAGYSNYKIIGNDTLGEKIIISYQKPGNYAYIKDTAAFWKNNFSPEEDDFEGSKDSTFIIKLDKRYDMPGGIKCRELHTTDTGSSRLIMVKYIYKNGHVFTLQTITDTLNKSPFHSNFFSSFTPADTLKGESLFKNKTRQFFADYFSEDSIANKKARKSLYNIEFNKEDVPLLISAVEKVNRKTRNYAEVKKYLISELGPLKDSAVIPFLKQLYWKVKDTSDFQNAILNALLLQKNNESFIAFKDLIIQETPVEEKSGNDYYSSSRNFQLILRSIRSKRTPRFDLITESSNYGSWSQLFDTLSLTRSIFPDFLQLMNVEDYKEQVTDLLVTMVDSGYLKAPDYESWFSKFYIDAKQLLKKQTAKEDADNMEKESRKDRKRTYYDYDEDEGEDEMSNGNASLEKYAILMMPFYDKNPGIPSFFEQLIKTRDRQLYYDICILLLRNNRPVPDSFFTNYAAIDKYRSNLYKDLEKLKMKDKFPRQYKKQEDIARSIFISNAGDYNKPDSLTYIDRLPVTYENKKGWVYFFKYKEERDDNFWQMGCVGMQPRNEDSIDIKNEDFVSTEGRKIIYNQPVKVQMEKMMRELLNARRESASEFYDARRYNIYKNYLSDIVKKYRFDD